MSIAMWRRYVAEFVGTFSLVFAGTVMRTMVGGETHDFSGVLLVHMVFAFTITIMVYSLCIVSGAHFNPAITLGFTLSRHFPWRYVLPYWLSQFAGAVFGSFLLFLLIPDKAAIAHFGATTPKIGYPQAVGVEIILTFFLMFISMATGTDKRFNRGASGIAVGLTVLLCGLAGNFLTGGSMNPARSLGPALFAGSQALSSYWIYVIGPVIGACIGALLYEFLRSDKRSAKNVPEDIVESKGYVSSDETKRETVRPVV